MFFKDGLLLDNNYKTWANMQEKMLENALEISSMTQQVEIWSLLYETGNEKTNGLFYIATLYTIWNNERFTMIWLPSQIK